MTALTSTELVNASQDGAVRIVSLTTMNAQPINTIVPQPWRSVGILMGDLAVFVSMETAARVVSVSQV